MSLTEAALGGILSCVCTCVCVWLTDSIAIISKHFDISWFTSRSYIDYSLTLMTPSVDEKPFSTHFHLIHTESQRWWYFIRWAVCEMLCLKLLSVYKMCSRYLPWDKGQGCKSYAPLSELFYIHNCIRLASIVFKSPKR